MPPPSGPGVRGREPFHPYPSLYELPTFHAARTNDQRTNEQARWSSLGERRRMSHVEPRSAVRGSKIALLASGVTTGHPLSFSRPDTPPPLTHSFPIPLSFFRPLCAGDGVRAACTTTAWARVLRVQVQDLVLCSILCPHNSRLPFERTMDKLLFYEWRFFGWVDQHSAGTSNAGRPARAVSHPTLNLRKALETHRPNLTLP
eukprot:scaffold5668_cov111-Isochrysis_galbana.AAC.21